DTSGAENYSGARRLFYPNTNIFLLTYPINDQQAFTAIKQWYKEVSHACPDATIVLAALNTQEHNACITAEEGIHLARSLGIEFIECDITNLDEVNHLIDTSIKLGAANLEDKREFSQAQNYSKRNGL